MSHPCLVVLSAPLIDSVRSVPARTFHRRRRGRQGWASRFALPHCPSANAAAGSRASGSSASAGRRLSINSGSWTGNSQRFMRPRIACRRGLPRACSLCAQNFDDRCLWRAERSLRVAGAPGVWPTSTPRCPTGRAADDPAVGRYRRAARLTTSGIGRHSRLGTGGGKPESGCLRCDTCGR